MKRAVSLKVQLLGLQVVIVLVLVCATGAVASTLQERQLRQAYLDRMTGVAQSVARLPAIRDAFDDTDPAATIQPIAEVIRKASNVTYVVVTDTNGIRYSHPNPARLGERVSTDPSIPLSGHVYTGTQTGTLGLSWRVKVPIYGAGEPGSSSSRAIVGAASVGILESELRADASDDLGWLFVALGCAVVIGVLCAAWVTRVVRRRIYRLEPEEIAALLKTRDAMLHGISEGVVAVDATGGIALVNDEARRLLGLGADGATGAVGQPAASILDPQLLDLTHAPDTTGGELVLAGERVLLARANAATVDGRDVGTVLVLRDRTELHALLRDLDGARGLTDALRAQSHEFANKLHVVSGLLELGRTDDAMAFIERAGHGGLLTASHVAPDVRSPEVAALLLVKATTCRERGLTLDVTAESRLSAPGDDATVALHGDVLTVLGNLIDNAVDAAREHVRVLVTDDGEPADSRTAVRIAVDDDGPGIPETRRADVFTAGFSTKGAPGRGEHARGIGLALVRRVVDRRDGRVDVGMSPLGGARIVVVLPGSSGHTCGTQMQPREVAR